MFGEYIGMIYYKFSMHDWRPHFEINIAYETSRGSIPMCSSV